MPRKGQDGTPVARKSPKAISTKEILAIVMDRFGQTTGGEFMSHGELANKYGRDKAQISRIISTAFRTRMVELRKVDIEPARDTVMEQKLEHHYGLMAAVVVDVNGLRTGEGDKNSQEATESAAYRDEVHILLGRGMAMSVIGRGLILRDGDCVGLGCGRGVFHTVDSLLIKQLRAKDISLRALSGHVHAKHHTDRGMTLDADFHCSLMASKFEHKVSPQLLARPIAYEDSVSRNEARAQTFAKEGEGWNEPKLNQAILGVGAYEEGHEFFDYCLMGPKAAADHILNPISEHLKELGRLCEQFGQEETAEWLPVGDVVNHLFLVEPYHTVPRWKDLKHKLEVVLSEINTRTLTAAPESLGNTPILLVAGTKAKTAAIRTVLDQNREPHLNVRYLCTDKPTAERLLGRGRGQDYEL